jgi:hypothetical protein
MKDKRFANENTKTPDNMRMPRIIYPNDILPDENDLTQMDREAQYAVEKTDGSNPR